MGFETVLVCDKCGSQSGSVERLTLITIDGRASFDLCHKCRKPIDEILKLMAEAPVRRTGRPSGLVKTITSKVYADPTAIPKRRGGAPKKGTRRPLSK